MRKAHIETIAVHSERRCGASGTMIPPGIEVDNPLTLQREQPCGQDSIHERAPSLKRHDIGSRSRLELKLLRDPGA